LPPHAGHDLLIDTATAHCDRVTVAVCDKVGQPIPGELRARWLRAQHPDIEVVVVDDFLPDDDSDGWAEYTRSFLGYTPDVVFTSEEYGNAFASALGCEHFVVDRMRTLVPISATDIRESPLAHLDSVSPDVRGYLVRRVCIIGSESTGKTTLCEKLAARFDAPFVGEYGRDYTLAKLKTSTPNDWRPDEFTHIAREQQRRENEAARTSRGLVVCDTDAFATEIWLERYLGSGHDMRGWPTRDRPIDRYLLTDPNVSFVPDAIRDGEHLRAWMFDRFREALDERGFAYEILSGTYEERETQAANVIAHVIETAKL
jgi:NadR type nicotinamide-nucleotide adenylyltransferase